MSDGIVLAALTVSALALCTIIVVVNALCGLLRNFMKTDK
jgi:hypothetical protein